MIKFSNKLKFKATTLNNIDNNLSNLLIAKLSENRAKATVDSNTIHFFTPTKFALSTGEITLFHRILRFGKGQISWRLEDSWIIYECSVSVKPILINSLILCLLMLGLLGILHVGNFSSNLISTGFIFALLVGLGIILSKHRLNKLIKDCIDEIGVE